MFERPHHRRIAVVLQSLDAALLREHGAGFGGGTAMALRFGEYRESVDIDFLVSRVDGYRTLRHLLTGPRGFAAIVRADASVPEQVREVRADQYGVRTAVRVDGQDIKFELVLEGRVVFEAPGADDVVCGVATLSSLDLATSKLLANSDRWRDDGVFSRDLIDLAMMPMRAPLLHAALDKAKSAYGDSVQRDLGKAIDNLRDRDGWLERCLTAMDIRLPKALVWQRVRTLGRLSQDASA